jgi:hypothetical protein
MTDIFVDPTIIVLPEQNETVEEKAAYLKLLNDWAEVTSPESDHDWYYPVGTIPQTLAVNGLMPDYDSLSALKAACAGRGILVDVNIHQILQWIKKFWDWTFDLDIKQLMQQLSRSGYSDLVEIKKESITFDPQKMAKRWHPSIKEDLSFLLALATICQSLATSPSKELHIATLKVELDNAETPANQVVITVQLVDIQENDSQGELLLKEDTITGTFPLLFIPQSLLKPVPNASDDLNLITPLKNWRWDGSQESLSGAIEKVYQELYTKLNISHFSFTFGPKFIKSIQDYQCSQNIKDMALKKIVRIGAAIIANQGHILNARLHKLRKNPGSTKQRTRRSDNAKAWRIDVLNTDGVAGIRLHYWQKSGGSIEFINIRDDADDPQVYENS